MKWKLTIGLLLAATLASAAVFVARPTPDHPSRSKAIRHAPSELNTQATRSQSPASLRDSVRLLLFAGFEVTRLVVRSAEEWQVNKRIVGWRDSIVVECSEKELFLDGEPSDSVVIGSRIEGALQLTAAERQRELRGVVRVLRYDGRLRIVATVARDDYLTAALASEASPNDPMEYLVALSVLQRNYLQAHSERHAPSAMMCDNTHCQVAFLKPASGRMREAVARASAIELQAGGSLPCYYGGCCGGSTILPSEIWKRPEPGYASVACRHCSGSRWYRWKRSVAVTPEIDRLMTSAPAAPFLDDDFKMLVGRAIGFNVVVSNTIRSIRRHGSRYVIEGSGFGHRVGLCQEGARTLARHGRSAEEILRFYFPAAQVNRTKDEPTERSATAEG